MKKTKMTIATIALILTLTFAATFVALPTANAKTLIKSAAFLSVQPQLIGVGQSFLVNAWITPFPLFNSTGYSILYKNYTFAITKPSGDVVNFVNITSEPSGTTWFTYLVDQIGTYKIVFSWAGDADHTAATSPASYVTVQEEPVQIGAPPAPLPTGYWTRPINAQNREWANIAGDWVSASWFQYDLADDCYNPYTTGPNTAHIIWDTPTQIGGLVGSVSGVEGTKYRGGRGTEAIIMAGRAYFSAGGQIECVDVHTGELYWTAHGSGTLLGEEGPSASLTGATGVGTYIWAIAPTTWTEYDAFNGAVVKTLTGVGSGFSHLYAGIDETSTAVTGITNKGSTTTGPYIVLAASNNFVVQILKVDLSKPGHSVSDLLVWNYTNANIYFSHYPTVENGVCAVIGYAPWFVGLNYTTGEILYNVTTSVQSDMRGSAGNGMLYCQMMGGGLTAYNVATGSVVWQKNPTEYPWGEFAGYALGVAYGMVYEGTYDGHVYAYNAQTGDVEWSYFVGNTTWAPYGTFPMYGKPAVADGKVYIGTTEHSPTNPFIEGFRMYCLDACNGTLLWSISGSYGSSSIADGVLVMTNMYDGIMYGFGKGQTAVTVSAPQTAITQGQSVMVTGTVMDKSEAQPNTPAVSDASMTQWMEYLHMQKPKPTDAKGVTVHLTAIDPNGNFQDIGYATTDLNGNFGKMWTPPVPGEYHITASFEGSKSYWSSDATTYFVVDKAPSAAQSMEPEPTELGSTEPISTGTEPTIAFSLGATEVAIIAAVAVAVVIGIAAYWTLRKRK